MNKSTFESSSLRQNFMIIMKCIVHISNGVIWKKIKEAKIYNVQKSAILKTMMFDYHVLGFTSCFIFMNMY